jgi:UrcA family protein
MNTAIASCLKANIPTAALLTLCAIASAAVAAPASDTIPVTRSTSVSLAGSDLSTPEGTRLARDRLRAAARRLCTQVADELDFSHQTNFVACVDETLATALHKVTEIGGVVTAATAKAP